MANEVKAESKELVVRYMIGENEIKLTPNIVKEYIVGNKNADITMQEFKLFSELCKTRQLNPFTKEVFLLKYGTAPATMIVSKQAILKRATMHPQFNGLMSGVFVKTAEGKVEKRDGGILLDDELLVGSWAEVYRKDWDKPMYCSCSMNEIKQAKNPSWDKMPCTMAIKTATCRACRDAFPEDLGGLYDADEISKPVEQGGFTESDLKTEEPNFEDVIEINESTGEVKSNKINLEDL